IGCDQATKQLAQSRLQGKPPQSFCHDVFRLYYTENPGAFLGLGGELPPGVRFAALVVINGCIAVAIAAVLWLRASMAWLKLFSCALVLAGALGNLVDRVRLDGLVIDFLNVGVGPLRTGIFNVADVALTTGAVLLCLGMHRPGS